MITGTGFVPDSIVLWNGKPEATQYYTSTRIQPILGIADVANPANVTVQVVNPSAGGGASAAVTYTVGPPTPAASFLRTILDFGSVAEGQASPSQEVFLTNTGSGVLHISSVTVSGIMRRPAHAAPPWVPMACAESLSLSPTASGTRTGMLPCMTIPEIVHRP